MQSLHDYLRLQDKERESKTVLSSGSLADWLVLPQEGQEGAKNAAKDAILSHAGAKDSLLSQPKDAILSHAGAKDSQEWAKDILSQPKKGHVEAGRTGGLLRAARLSPERRSEIARAASRARWAKRKKVDRIGFVPGYRLEDYSAEEIAAGLRNRHEI